MVTSEEITQVPLFSSLSAAERERLSRSAPTSALRPGEYAVHEGEDRALFVVLEGRIEVVKLVDGIERVLGERMPGAIFGEVPITLGTAFPSGFRAAEPSRVMQIDVRHYYELASASPDVALKIGALARERIGGLRASRQRRRSLARISSATAGTRPAPIYAVSRPQPDHVRVDHAGRRRTPPSAGAEPLPPEDDFPPFARRRRDTRAAGAACGRRVARAADAARTRRSTTRSSSAPDRPVSPPPSTARPRACARS